MTQSKKLTLFCEPIKEKKKSNDTYLKHDMKIRGRSQG